MVDRLCNINGWPLVRRKIILAFISIGGIVLVIMSGLLDNSVAICCATTTQPQSAIIPTSNYTRVVHQYPSQEFKTVNANCCSTSDDLLFFNRVPKTGSTNLALLIQKISTTNGFLHFRFGNPDLRSIPRRDQVRNFFIAWVKTKYFFLP